MRFFLLAILAGNVFAQTPTTGDWLPVPAHGPPVNAVGWETLTYIPTLGAHCWQGTFHDMGSEPNFSLNCWNPLTNYFSLNQFGGQTHLEDTPESGHPSSTQGFRVADGLLYMIGMDSGSNQAENPFFMWAQDLVAQTSRNIQTGLTPFFPSLLGQGAGTFDDFHDVLLMHGGDSFFGTWLYAPTTNTWDWITDGVDTCESSPGNVIACPMSFESLHLSSACYDSVNHRIWLWAGKVGDTYYDNLAWWDHTNSAWVITSPVGGVKPPGRDRGGLACDTTNSVLMAYGGVNADGNLTDTWIYTISSNTWVEQSPMTVPDPTPGIFSRLSYDPTINAFVLVNTNDSENGYLDGTWNAYNVLVYVYRYAGSGSDIGSASPSFTAPASSRNRNGNTAWAKEPTLLMSGSTPIVAFTETSAAFTGNGATTAPGHVMAAQLSAGAWSFMGTSTAINTDEGGNKSSADRPKLVLSGSTVWEAHNQFSYGGIITSSVSQVYAKSWNGSAWSGGQIGITNLASGISTSDMTITVTAGTGATLPPSSPFTIRIDGEGILIASRSTDTLTVMTRNYGGGGSALQSHSAGAEISVLEHTQGWQDLIDCNGTPYIVFGESNHISNPVAFLYVKKWDGTDWVLVGTSFLNTASSNTRIEDASIACDGTNPIVAWSEWTTNFSTYTNSAPQVYVKQWSGSSWDALGASLNVNGTSRAFAPSITWMGSTPYVAWVERTATGTAQLYVKSWDGMAWNAVGMGSRNQSGSGWAWKPHLINDGTNLYLGWAEQSAIGSRPQAYVSKYASGSWSSLGGSLNSDSTNGSVERVSLAMNGANPAATFGEVNDGYSRQVFVKSWTGTAWTILPSSGTTISGGVTLGGNVTIQ